MLLMQVNMVQQNGNVFHWTQMYLFFLPKKIPRISEGDYFRDRHREQMEEKNST